MICMLHSDQYKNVFKTICRAYQLVSREGGPVPVPCECIPGSGFRCYKIIFPYWTLFKKSVILPFFFNFILFLLLLLLTLISWREQNFCRDSSISSEERMRMCSTGRQRRSSFWEKIVSWVLVSLGAELQEMSSRAGLIRGKKFHLFFFPYLKPCFVEVAIQAQDSLQMPALEILLHRISQTDGGDIHWAFYLFCQ